MRTKFADASLATPVLSWEPAICRRNSMSTPVVLSSLPSSWLCWLLRNITRVGNAGKGELIMDSGAGWSVLECEGFGWI